MCQIPLNKGTSLVVGIGFPGNVVVRSSNYIERIPCVYSTTKSREGRSGETPREAMQPANPCMTMALNSSLDRHDAVFSPEKVIWLSRDKTHDAFFQQSKVTLHLGKCSSQAMKQVFSECSAIFFSFLRIIIRIVTFAEKANYNQ